MTCIGRKSGEDRGAPMLATRTCVCGLPGLSTITTRAGVVAGAEELCARDPHLAARGDWVRVNTPEGDEVIMDGVPYRLGRTPASVRHPGPLLGEHTSHVLERFLGLDLAEIAALRNDGVIA